jgi:ADP-ribose/FAD diphosphatase
MKFCSACGSTVERRIPEGEDRERWVCPACGVIHYENPRMVVGCLIEDEGRILLCKRAIEPRYGYWTVPAGFLELGESAAAGSVRETLEEAGARVGVVAPYAHFDIPHIGQAYIFYRARMLSPEHSAGTESLEVKFVQPNEIPWGDLAFSVVRVALELFVDDMRSKRYRLHHGVISRNEAGRHLLEDHVAVPIGRH